MKVKTLLAMAAKCTTEKDAQTLLSKLSEAFEVTRALGHLGVMNQDFMMEDSGPYVKFELNHVISEHYITCIAPEVRDGKLSIVVTTNHMLDGLGLSSQSWSVVEGLEEDVIEAKDDQSISDLAKVAKMLALANHAELISRVGVLSQQAKIAAKKSW